MAKQKVIIGVFRHAECKSGLYFVLALLLYRILVIFLVQTHDGFWRFSVKRQVFGVN